MAKRYEEIEEEEILWYNWDLADAKDLDKAITKVKRICQQTPEYEVWAKRTKIGTEKCPVCLEYYQHIKADTHHHPITISEVIENIFNELIMSGEIDDLSFIGMVHKVMLKHMLKQVDYIVICTHCHEKFHAGDPSIFRKIDMLFKHQVSENYLNDLNMNDHKRKNSVI